MFMFDCSPSLRHSRYLSAMKLTTTQDALASLHLATLEKTLLWGVRFETPPISKAHQCQKNLSFCKANLGKTNQKVPQNVRFSALEKNFQFDIGEAFFRDETLISGRNIPCCMAFFGPKRHPFVREYVKSGSFCKANFLELTLSSGTPVVYRVNGVQLLTFASRTDITFEIFTNLPCLGLA